MSVWEPFILNSGLVARRDQPPPADAAVQCSLKCSGVAWWLLSVTTGTPAGCWLSTWHASQMAAFPRREQAFEPRPWTGTRILPESQPHDAERGNLGQGDPTFDARALSRIRGDTTCAGSVAVLVAVVWREPSRKAWAQCFQFSFTPLPEALQDAPLWLVTSMLAGGERGARCRSIGHFCCFVLPRPKWDNPGLDRHGKDPLPS